MTIWLLALILGACLAGLNYRQGAIRVGFSLLGILFGAGLAAPLGAALKHLLSIVGLKQPVLLWALGPVLVFFIILLAFKIAGLAVHQKVEVFYKYRAGDSRLLRWERLNRRLGLCLGTANWAAYLTLVSLVIYSLSYWTVPLASGASDPKWMRALNKMGGDLQSTGFAKVARAIDSKPGVYYDMADLAGVLYGNSLLEARLLLYPAFLGLVERPELQAIATDKDLTEMWQRHDPILGFYDNPKVQAVLNNPALLRLIWSTGDP